MRGRKITIDLGGEPVGEFTVASFNWFDTYIHEKKGYNILLHRLDNSMTVELTGYIAAEQVRELMDFLDPPTWKVRFRRWLRKVSEAIESSLWVHTERVGKILEYLK